MKRAIAAAGAVAIGAVVLFVLLIHNPLVPGNDFAADPTNLDPSGEFFVYAPDADYYVMTTMENTGPLPISVNGVEANYDPGRVAPYVVDLRIAHGVSETMNMATLANSEPFHPVDVGSGESLALWVHYRTGPCFADGSLPYQPGSGTGFPVLDVQWSLYGFPRVSSVPLVTDFVARNVDDPDLCSGDKS
jgi:hypothetical protein